jgi:hypothetical protein
MRDPYDGPCGRAKRSRESRDNGILRTRNAMSIMFLEIFLRNMRAKFPLEMKEVILDVDDDERGASIVRTLAFFRHATSVDKRR